MVVLSISIPPPREQDKLLRVNFYSIYCLCGKEQEVLAAAREVAILVTGHRRVESGYRIEFLTV